MNTEIYYLFMNIVEGKGEKMESSNSLTYPNSYFK